MEITVKKKAAIKKLLKITDAVRSSETIMNLFMEQIMEMLKEPGDSIDLGTFNLMKKEAKALIHEEVVIKESLHLLMYPLYHKYLTLEEIDGLIQFNKTPLGQKMISINSRIVRESMEIGQVWGEKLSLEFQKRMSEILESTKNIKYFEEEKGE